MTLPIIAMVTMAITIVIKWFIVVSLQQRRFRLSEASELAGQARRRRKMLTSGRTCPERRVREVCT